VRGELPRPQLLAPQCEDCRGDVGQLVVTASEWNGTSPAPSGGGSRVAMWAITSDIVILDVAGALGGWTEPSRQVAEQVVLVVADPCDVAVRPE
jgi:hypothetical protein